MRDSKHSSMREVHGNKTYPRIQEKSQINNLNLHRKELEKEEQTKLKGSRRKEIIKVRAGINEIEALKKIEDK